MDQLFAPGYDERWGEIDPTHHAWVRRLVDMTPADGLLLDAACGTGRYWQQILAAERRVIGADRSGAMLDQARLKYPDVEARQVSLEELHAQTDLIGGCDGVLCVDAMENVFPEDWPVVLGSFALVLRPQGPLYLTVELPDDEDRELAANPTAPLVPGEVLWPDDRTGTSGYHYFPAIDQVASWLDATGFALLDSTEGDGYHHLLAKRADDRVAHDAGRA